MKNKHHGLASLIIFGLSLIGILVYGVYLADKITASIVISKPISVPDIKVPDESTMAYINFLSSHLTDLAALKKRNPSIDLKLFGFNPSLPGKNNKIETRPLMNTPAPLQEDKKEVHFSYTLTLCFASLKTSFCVIDGKLYKVNGVLPDGGKILKIENDRVFMLKHNRKEWIYTLRQQEVSKGKNEDAI